MKLYHVNVNLQGIESWLADELTAVVSKLPEYGESISMESLVLARTPADAAAQMHGQVMRAIAKHQLMDLDSIRQLSRSLEGEQGMIVAAIPMSDPRVLFLNCPILANAA